MTPIRSSARAKAITESVERISAIENGIIFMRDPGDAISRISIPCPYSFIDWGTGHKEEGIINLAKAILNYALLLVGHEGPKIEDMPGVYIFTMAINNAGAFAMFHLRSANIFEHRIKLKDIVYFLWPNGMAI